MKPSDVALRKVVCCNEEKTTTKFIVPSQNASTNASVYDFKSYDSCKITKDMSPTDPNTLNLFPRRRKLKHNHKPICYEIENAQLKILKDSQSPTYVLVFHQRRGTEEQSSIHLHLSRNDDITSKKTYKTSFDCCEGYKRNKYKLGVKNFNNDSDNLVNKLIKRLRKRKNKKTNLGFIHLFKQKTCKNLLRKERSLHCFMKNALRTKLNLEMYNVTKPPKPNDKILVGAVFGYKDTPDQKFFVTRSVSSKEEINGLVNWLSCYRHGLKNNHISTESLASIESEIESKGIAIDDIKAIVTVNPKKKTVFLPFNDEMVKKCMYSEIDYSNKTIYLKDRRFISGNVLKIRLNTVRIYVKRYLKKDLNDNQTNEVNREAIQVSKPVEPEPINELHVLLQLEEHNNIINGLLLNMNKQNSSLTIEELIINLQKLQTIKNIFSNSNDQKYLPSIQKIIKAITKKISQCFYHSFETQEVLSEYFENRATESKVESLLKESIHFEETMKQVKMEVNPKIGLENEEETQKIMDFDCGDLKIDGLKTESSKNDVAKDVLKMDSSKNDVLNIDTLNNDHFNDVLHMKIDVLKTETLKNDILNINASKNYVFKDVCDVDTLKNQVFKTDILKNDVLEDLLKMQALKNDVFEDVFKMDSIQNDVLKTDTLKNDVFEDVLKINMLQNDVSRNDSSKTDLLKVKTSHTDNSNGDVSKPDPQIDVFSCPKSSQPKIEKKSKLNESIKDFSNELRKACAKFEHDRTNPTPKPANTEPLSVMAQNLLESCRTDREKIRSEFGDVYKKFLSQASDVDKSGLSKKLELVYKALGNLDELQKKLDSDNRSFEEDSKKPGSKKKVRINTEDIKKSNNRIIQKKVNELKAKLLLTMEKDRATLSNEQPEEKKKKELCIDLSHTTFDDNRCNINEKLCSISSLVDRLNSKFDEFKEIDVKPKKRLEKRENKENKTKDILSKDFSKKPNLFTQKTEDELSEKFVLTAKKGIENLEKQKTTHVEIKPKPENLFSLESNKSSVNELNNILSNIEDSLKNFNLAALPEIKDSEGSYSKNLIPESRRKLWALGPVPLDISPFAPGKIKKYKPKKNDEGDSKTLTQKSSKSSSKSSLSKKAVSESKSSTKLLEVSSKSKLSPDSILSKTILTQKILNELNKVPKGFKDLSKTGSKVCKVSELNVPSIQTTKPGLEPYPPMKDAIPSVQHVLSKTPKGSKSQLKDLEPAKEKKHTCQAELKLRDLLKTVQKKEAVRELARDRSRSPGNGGMFSTTGHVSRVTMPARFKIFTAKPQERSTFLNRMSTFMEKFTASDWSPICSEQNSLKSNVSGVVKTSKNDKISDTININVKQTLSVNYLKLKDLIESSNSNLEKKQIKQNEKEKPSKSQGSKLDKKPSGKGDKASKKTEQSKTISKKSNKGSNSKITKKGTSKVSQKGSKTSQKKAPKLKKTTSTPIGTPTVSTRSKVKVRSTSSPLKKQSTQNCAKKEKTILPHLESILNWSLSTAQPLKKAEVKKATSKKSVDGAKSRSGSPKKKEAQKVEKVKPRKISSSEAQKRSQSVPPKKASPERAQKEKKPSPNTSRFNSPVKSAQNAANRPSVTQLIKECAKKRSPARNKIPLRTGLLDEKVTLRSKDSSKTNSLLKKVSSVERLFWVTKNDDDHKSSCFNMYKEEFLNYSCSNNDGFSPSKTSGSTVEGAKISASDKVFKIASQGKVEERNEINLFRPSSAPKTYFADTSKAIFNHREEIEELKKFNEKIPVKIDDSDDRVETISEILAEFEKKELQNAIPPFDKKKFDKFCSKNKLSHLLTDDQKPFFTFLTSNETPFEAAMPIKSTESSEMRRIFNNPRKEPAKDIVEMLLPKKSVESVKKVEPKVEKVEKVEKIEKLEKMEKGSKPQLPRGVSKSQPRIGTPTSLKIKPKVQTQTPCDNSLMKSKYTLRKRRVHKKPSKTLIKRILVKEVSTSMSTHKEVKEPRFIEIPPFMTSKVMRRSQDLIRRSLQSAEIKHSNENIKSEVKNKPKQVKNTKEDVKKVKRSKDSLKREKGNLALKIAKLIRVKKSPKIESIIEESEKESKDSIVPKGNFKISKDDIPDIPKFKPKTTEDGLNSKTSQDLFNNLKRKQISPEDIQAARQKLKKLSQELLLQAAKYKRSQNTISEEDIRVDLQTVDYVLGKKSQENMNENTKESLDKCRNLDLVQNRFEMVTNRLEIPPKAGIFENTLGSFKRSRTSEENITNKVNNMFRRSKTLDENKKLKSRKNSPENILDATKHRQSSPMNLFEVDAKKNSPVNIIEARKPRKNSPENILDVDMQKSSPMNLFETNKRHKSPENLFEMNKNRNRSPKTLFEWNKHRDNSPENIFEGNKRNRSPEKILEGNKYNENLFEGNKHRNNSPEKLYEGNKHRNHSPENMLEGNKHRNRSPVTIEAKKHRNDKGRISRRSRSPQIAKKDSLPTKNFKKGCKISHEDLKRSRSVSIRRSTSEQNIVRNSKHIPRSDTIENSHRRAKTTPPMNSQQSNGSDLLKFQSTPFANSLVCWNFTPKTIENRPGSEHRQKVVEMYHGGSREAASKNIVILSEKVPKHEPKRKISRETNNKSVTFVDRVNRKAKKHNLMKDINVIDVAKGLQQGTKLEKYRNKSNSKSRHSSGARSVKSKVITHKNEDMVIKMQKNNRVKEKLSSNSLDSLNIGSRNESKAKPRSKSLPKPQLTPSGDATIVPQQPEAQNIGSRNHSPAKKDEILNKIQNTLKDVTKTMINISEKYIPMVEKRTMEKKTEKKMERDKIVVGETNGEQNVVEIVKYADETKKYPIDSKAILTKSLQNSLIILKKLNEASKAFEGKKSEPDTESLVPKVKKTAHKNEPSKKKGKNRPIVETTNFVKLKNIVDMSKNGSMSDRLSQKSNFSKVTTSSKLITSTSSMQSNRRMQVQIKTIAVSPDLDKTSKRIMNRPPVKKTPDEFDRLTLKDFPPIHSEYPRRDHQVHTSVENTFLFKLVNGLYDTKSILRLEPKLQCSDATCQSCNDKLSIDSKKTEDDPERDSKKPLNADLGKRNGKKFNFKKYMSDLYKRHGIYHGMKALHAYPVSVNYNFGPMRYKNDNRSMNSGVSTRNTSPKKLPEPKSPKPDIVQRNIDQAIIKTVNTVSFKKAGKNSPRGNVKNKVKKNECNIQKKSETLAQKAERIFSKNYAKIEPIAESETDVKKKKKEDLMNKEKKMELQSYIELVEDKFLKTFSLPEKEKVSAYKVLEHEIKNMLDLLAVSNNQDVNVGISKSIERMNKTGQKGPKAFNDPVLNQEPVRILKDIKSLLTDGLEKKAALGPSNKKKTKLISKPTESISFINSLQSIINKQSAHSQCLAPETVTSEQVNAKLFVKDFKKISKTSIETFTSDDYDTIYEETISANSSASALQTSFVNVNYPLSVSSVEHQSDINLTANTYEAIEISDSSRYSFIEETESNTTFYTVTNFDVNPSDEAIYPTFSTAPNTPSNNYEQINSTSGSLNDISEDCMHTARENFEECYEPNRTYDLANTICERSENYKEKNNQKYNCNDNTIDYSENFSSNRFGQGSEKYGQQTDGNVTLSDSSSSEKHSRSENAMLYESLEDSERFKDGLRTKNNDGTRIHEDINGISEVYNIENKIYNEEKMLLDSPKGYNFQKRPYDQENIVSYSSEGYNLQTGKYDQERRLSDGFIDGSEVYNLQKENYDEERMVSDSSEGFNLQTEKNDQESDRNNRFNVNTESYIQNNDEFEQSGTFSKRFDSLGGCSSQNKTYNVENTYDRFNERSERDIQSPREFFDESETISQKFDGEKYVENTYDPVEKIYECSESSKFVSCTNSERFSKNIELNMDFNAGNILSGKYAAKKKSTIHNFFAKLENLSNSPSVNFSDVSDTKKGSVDTNSMMLTPNDSSLERLKKAQDLEDLEIDISLFETESSDNITKRIEERMNTRAMSAKMLEFLDIVTSLSFDNLSDTCVYYKRTEHVIVRLNISSVYNVTHRYHRISYYYSGYFEALVENLSKTSNEIGTLIKKTSSPRRGYRLMSFKDPRLRKYTSLPEFDLTDEIFLRNICKNSGARSLESLICDQNRLNSLCHTMVVNLQLLNHSPDKNLLRGRRKKVRMRGITQIGRFRNVGAKRRTSSCRSYKWLLVTTYLLVFCLVFFSLVLNFKCE